MKRCFGYIRVSTVKQGERGVSLQEQRDAVVRYAARAGISVIRWFEEQETAAKRGRPIFTAMLKLLRQRKADGVIMHKIDRSARNLRDWADLGELIDSGIELHFANDGLDLSSRGGRLSADIQAVVAADYIRNLREEARKGFYGRLKQGVLPLPAPVGYLNQGAGKPKAIDPVMGPLVRRAFELYASGRHSLSSLTEVLAALGLRSRRGSALSRISVWGMLQNPFYMGIIRIVKTGETFDGAHPPLISPSLFKEVQRVLHGKCGTSNPTSHQFTYRRLLACACCHRSLIGERQKGHVYYRCHTPGCTASLREDRLDSTLATLLEPLGFSPEEREFLPEALRSVGVRWLDQRRTESQALQCNLGNVTARLAKLTDAFLDGTIEKDLFEERKAALLVERRNLEESLDRLEREPNRHLERLQGVVSLATRPLFPYMAGSPDEKRDYLKTVTSNRLIEGNSLAIQWDLPFSLIVDRPSVKYSGLNQNKSRTLVNLPQTTAESLEFLLEAILHWIIEHPEEAGDRP